MWGCLKILHPPRPIMAGVVVFFSPQKKTTPKGVSKGNQPSFSRTPWKWKRDSKQKPPFLGPPGLIHKAPPERMEMEASPRMFVGQGPCKISPSPSERMDMEASRRIYWFLV